MVDDDGRIRTAYVRARLCREIGEGRGGGAKFARAVKHSPAHVINVKNGKIGVGERFARAAAKHWKMTLDQLDEEARREAQRDAHFAAFVRGETDHVESSEGQPLHVFRAQVAPRPARPLTLDELEAVARRARVGPYAFDPRQVVMDTHQFKEASPEVRERFLELHVDPAANVVDWSRALLNLLEIERVERSGAHDPGSLGGLAQLLKD